MLILLCIFYPIIINHYLHPECSYTIYSDIYVQVYRVFRAYQPVGSVSNGYYLYLHVVIRFCVLPRLQARGGYRPVGQDTDMETEIIDEWFVCHIPIVTLFPQKSMNKSMWLAEIKGSIQLISSLKILYAPSIKRIWVKLSDVIWLYDTGHGHF